jgi:hypothetical protein
MQEGNDSNAVIGGDICKSLIILVVIKKIILTDSSRFQSKVSCLICTSVNEGRNVLNVEARATLILRFIAQRVAIVTIDNLKI